MKDKVVVAARYCARNIKKRVWFTFDVFMARDRPGLGGEEGREINSEDPKRKKKKRKNRRTKKSKKTEEKNESMRECIKKEDEHHLIRAV